MKNNSRHIRFIFFIILIGLTKPEISVAENEYNFNSLPEWQIISSTDSIEQIAPIFHENFGPDYDFRSPFFLNGSDDNIYRDFSRSLPALVCEVGLYQYRKDFNYQDSIIILSKPVCSYFNRGL